MSKEKETIICPPTKKTGFTADRKEDLKVQKRKAL